MDCVVCGPRAPYFYSVGPHRVPIQGPHTTYNRQKEVYSAAKGSVVGGGFIRRSGETFIDINPPPQPQKEDGGMDLNCIVHGEHNRTLGPRMEELCIPSMQNITPRLAPLL